MRAMLTDVDYAGRLQRGAAGAALVVCLGIVAVVWAIGSSNPFTPAGYVGYLTKGAVIGHSRFTAFSAARRPLGAPGCST